GLIAGGTMRAVLGLAGVVDVLTKSLGSSNPSNVVKAAFKAIAQMNSKEQIREKLGKN
ncbi:MAG: 30S ribosomal protein S5, partial [Lentisphaeria bacterium]|nr:30S ribosomal protein S5 [Lentisphaeria bacterium]